MTRKEVVDIDFYVHDNLPYPLMKEAEKQDIKIKEGLIAVKTIGVTPVKYEFVMIGKTSAELKIFYSDLASEDGIDLNEVAQSIIN